MPGLVTGPILAAGDAHSLARDGTPTGVGLWGWGNNANQLIGQSATNPAPPTFLYGQFNFGALAAGWEFSLGLTLSRRVYAWGSNEFGQIAVDSPLPVGTPTQVRDVTPGKAKLLATSIAAGAEHCLAVTVDGSVVAWGRNHEGQLGASPSTLAGTNRPRVVLPPPRPPVRIVKVAAGRAHSLALLSNGKVLAWGSNEDRQLGLTDTDRRWQPTLVKEVENAVAIAAGFGWSMALRSDGTVLAWGGNNNRQLGEASSSAVLRRARPVAVQGLSGVWAIAAGHSHGVALAGGTPANPNVVRWGEVWTWGRGQEGQLGDGSSTLRPTPRRVPTIEQASAIAAGSLHTLALVRRPTDSRAVLAWGSNSQWQLGVQGGESPALPDGGFSNPVVVPGVSSGFGFI